MRENLRLPKQIAGVYYLYAGEEIVYVGQSVNVFHRVGYHAGNCVAFDTWSFEEITDPAKRIEHERAEIAKHRPKFNVLKRKNWHTERMMRLGLLPDRKLSI